MTREQTQDQAQDNRGSLREDVLGPGISCFTTTPRGRLIEGVVRDISDSGTGITADAEGLEVGQQVQVVFVVASGQKVRFHGFVKHVEYDLRHCGIQFTSGPENLDPSYDPRATADAQGSKNRAPKCTRCETQMEIGYIVDHTHVGRRREMVCPPQWAPGVAGRGVALRGAGSNNDRRAFRVETFRCPDCGMLESYANKPQF